MILVFRFFTILLCISCSLQSFGQQDTLTLKDNTELSSIINEHYYKNPKLALAASKVFLKRASLKNDPLTIYLGYDAVAQTFAQTKDFEQAFIYGDSALLHARKLKDDSLIIKAYDIKARLYMQDSKWSMALEEEYKALRHADSVNATLSSLDVLNTLGWINSSLGDRESAVIHLKDALKRLNSNSNLASLSQTQSNDMKLAFLANIADAYNKLFNGDSAKFYLDKSFEVIDKKTDTCNLESLYRSLAKTHIIKNEFDRAMTSIGKSDTICLPKSNLDILIASGLRGEALLGKKKYEEAIKIMTHGLKVYKAAPSEEKYMDNYYSTLAKAYKNLKNIDSANFYLEKHIYSTTAFNSLKEDVTSSFKKEEIKTFKQELEQLAQQKSQKEKLLLYGSLTGGLIIILLILSLISSHKKRKENEIKFEALVAKVSAAQKAGNIIDTKDKILDEQSTSDVNPETTQQILGGLKKLEEQNYFLHPACSAHNVAKRIKTNTTYLSKVINAEFGKNFSTYINDLRINYAIVRLKQDSKFRSYTISSIATELGYKSADSFTKYFKKDTGLLPSFYIKKLNEIT